MSYFECSDLIFLSQPSETNQQRRGLKTKLENDFYLRDQLYFLNTFEVIVLEFEMSYTKGITVLKWASKKYLGFVRITNMFPESPKRVNDEAGTASQRSTVRASQPPTRVQIWLLVKSNLSERLIELTLEQSRHRGASLRIVVKDKKILKGQP